MTPAAIVTLVLAALEGALDLAGKGGEVILGLRQKAGSTVDAKEYDELRRKVMEYEIERQAEVLRHAMVERKPDGSVAVHPSELGGGRV